MGISRTTAHKWVRRWRAEGDAGLYDRSSRPLTTPHRTPADVENRICELRRERKLGPVRIGPILEMPASTVSGSGRPSFPAARGRCPGRTSGPDWTASTDESGNPVNIEDRSPERRVFTRRMMAAWSAGDTDTFDALLNAACAEQERRRSYLGDLFQLTVDETELHGQRAGRPFVVVRQLTKSILKEGLKKADWNSS